jgi:hypothetical protein
MDINFRCERFITTLYLAPRISPKGKLAAWEGCHRGWKRGFVVRVLWFGFLLRWDKIKPVVPSIFSSLEWAVNQMDNGGYPLDLLDPIACGEQ